MSAPQNEEVFELRTRSLREQLVPALDWLEEFQKIECTGPIEISISTLSSSIMKNYWMVKYPFNVPIYVRYVSNKFPDKYYITDKELSKLTHEDFQNIVELVQSRAASFVANMLPEEAVSMIDANYDYGVIIHGTTGRVHPFSYPDIESIDFAAMPVASEIALLSTIGENHVNMDDYQKLSYFRTIYNDRFMYNAWIMPKFIRPDGDLFNNTKNHLASWSLTELAHMNPEDYIAVVNYIKECIKLHFKTMVVP